MFKANENLYAHVNNMDYTEIQNAKALAMDNEDWASLTELDALEAHWLASQ